MGHATVSEFRSNIAKYLDEVTADRTELVITRQNSEPVVVLPLSDWQSMQETLYLLGNPANAEHLRQSIADADAGKLFEHELIEPEPITK
jgi:antitoxin YefM